MKEIKLEITQAEYEELIAKLANEIEVYGDQASAALMSVFRKIIAEDPFEETHLTALACKYI